MANKLRKKIRDLLPKNFTMNPKLEIFTDALCQAIEEVVGAEIHEVSQRAYRKARLDGPARFE